MNAAWLAALQAKANQPPAAPRLPLQLAAAGDAVVGSIEPALAQRLGAAGLPVEAAHDAVRVRGHAEAALAHIARWLHEQGLAGRWRDEAIAVADAAGTMHARIERAAVRPLGITTAAVHLAARHADGRWWLQQRALDKATDPGLWDTLMGGLVSADESIELALERETWEEAGLRLAELDALRHRGEFWVRRPLAEGYMVERTVVYEGVVRAALAPVNQDGEVQRFECVDEATLRARLLAGEFTLEAALALALVLGC